jgi:hypothetical protein
MITNVVLAKHNMNRYLQLVFHFVRLLRYTNDMFETNIVPTWIMCACVSM